ncbi:MAG: DUF2628 domain-containing protein [Phreatobacter sp.]
MARLTSFTVHVPPAGASRDADVATEFVADTFSWVAFLVPWLWFLWHRMWLATAAYLVLLVALMSVAALAGLSSTAGMVIGTAFNLLVGLEATNLRRRKLRWLGYQQAGVVVARNREEAERRWFTEQTAVTPSRPAPPERFVAAATPAAPAASTGIIGLFPDADPSARGGR